MWQNLYPTLILLHHHWPNKTDLRVSRFDGEAGSVLSAGSAIKDERVDAEKASRRNETYSKERTKIRPYTFPRSTTESGAGNRGEN